MTFTAGQEVLFIHSGNRFAGDEDKPLDGATVVTVVKVGRKLAHVDHGYGRLETYRLDTGHATKDFGGRIATRETLEAEALERQVRTRLREEYGVTFQGGRWRVPPFVQGYVLSLLDVQRMTLEG